MNANESSAGPAAGASKAPVKPAASVHAFVSALLERYRRLRETDHPALRDRETSDARLAELQLAEAVLRHVASDDRYHLNWPRQLAVIGPTQTGKSTIVNVLLGQSLAEVSPLAGFTIHPQGFWQPESGSSDEPATLHKPIETLFDAAESDRVTSDGAHDRRWAELIFRGWQRCDLSALTRDNLRAYALTVVEPAAPLATPNAEARSGTLPHCVIWDTPDFDSLAAREYREGLLSAIAAADAYLLVVSKEKYSDLSVWRLLQLLAPLGRPLIICANKLTSDATDAIVMALHHRLREHKWAEFETPIVRIGYDPELSAPAKSPPAQRELRECVADGLARADRAKWPAHAAGLVRQHWDAWTAPIEREHAALDEWKTLVAEALAALLSAYRRDYLDHPRRYDGFRRATAELLTLLEIPGVGNALTQVRQVVTWPARQVWRMGRVLFDQNRQASAHGLSNEQVFLYDEIEKLLTHMQCEVARRGDRSKATAVVWQALGRQLEAESPRLRDLFQQAAREHDEQTQHAIHVAAGRLYEALKERPKLLNVLRAARVTADAGSIALAIKTGGATVNDLLLAPAMFGVVSLMTEGALGTYMKRIAEELKEKQYEIARNELIGVVVQEQLVNLTARLDDQMLFGISAERLAEVRRALDEWE